MWQIVYEANAVVPGSGLKNPSAVSHGFGRRERKVIEEHTRQRQWLTESARMYVLA